MQPVDGYSTLVLWYDVPTISLKIVQTNTDFEWQKPNCADYQENRLKTETWYVEQMAPQFHAAAPKRYGRKLWS